MNFICNRTDCENKIASEHIGMKVEQENTFDHWPNFKATKINAPTFLNAMRWGQ